MLFNSIEFPVFFIVVFVLFFSIPARFRWILLLFSSYYFYASWKLEYLSLIVFSTVIDYFVALKIFKTESKQIKKRLLLISLVGNLGILVGFKYFNFFSANVQDAINFFNLSYSAPIFDVLLPVGISFYTFQTLSYTIDVYKGRIEPEKHFGVFALYVSFFPQLVAGPIERPSNLLPQFNTTRNFSYESFSEGFKLAIWGFFKKVVIADRLAEYVNLVYDDPTIYQGPQVIVATVFFAFQIYCDFSGYSDIAIGISKMMGYDLMKNFNRPYSSKSIREFWSKWHISLSTWFRDYLYIPLGGNRVVKWRYQYNIFITFLVSGLWHGANWTFIVWGGLHGFYLICEGWASEFGVYLKKVLGESKTPVVPNWTKKTITFILVCFAWIFFRANSVGDAVILIKSLTDFSAQTIFITSKIGFLLSVFFILFMELIHILEKDDGLVAYFKRQHYYLNISFYYLLICFILFFGVFKEQEFIYFQF